MKVEGSEVWWSEPWREEDDDLAAMRDSPDDADAEPTSSSSLPNGESAAAVSVTQDSGAGDVSDGDGGSDSEGEGIGDEAEKKLEIAVTSALLNVIASPSKISQTVKVPVSRGGGEVYKRTLIDSFNDTGEKNSKERLSRIKLSTKQITDMEVANSKRASVVASARPGGASSLSAASPVVGDKDETEEVEVEKEEEARGPTVSVGSDIAFAMVESGSKSACWIGRVDVVYKGKAIYKTGVDVSDGLPEGFSVVCEWYTPAPSAKDAPCLLFEFPSVKDRAKYPLTSSIGLVRIDITNEGRGGDSKDVYAISDATRIALDAALELTVPVSRSSKQTKGQQKAKAEKRRREAESHKEELQRPRLNLRPEGGTRRGATRGVEVDGEERRKKMKAAKSEMP